MNAADSASNNDAVHETTVLERLRSERRGIPTTQTARMTTIGSDAEFSGQPSQNKATKNEAALEPFGDATRAVFNFEARRAEHTD